ncbi:MAG TPA: glycosyltransferase, partial [Thermoanaerobaculia bacterium]|nr:glycosyltransferase [Thermoanaerobaculia bacterium]
RAAEIAGPAAAADPQVASLPHSLAHLIGDSGFRISRGEARWLVEDAAFEQRRRPRIPRLAMVLHRHRSDLRASFPDPLGRDREGFATWYVTFGKLEYGLPAALTRPVVRRLRLRSRGYVRWWWARRAIVRRLRPLLRRGRLPSHAPRGPLLPLPPVDAALPPAAVQPPAPAHGLNVVGWTNAPTGVGEACRGTLAALAAVGLDHRVWSLRHPGLEDASPAATGDPPSLPYKVTLYHVNADMMPWVEARIPLRQSRGHYRIGYWYWELAHFPLQLAHSFRYLDELWAPTRFCRDAFGALASIDVHWVPPAVREPQGRALDRRGLGVPEAAFLFFFAFDALSVPQRKNPSGLLCALSRALELTDRPLHLLLKVSHGDETELLQQLRQQSRDLPVTLITRSLSRSEMNDLTATCDAYVSLHRSEGLGLPLIEAMYLGKPVIATGYGGCTDFLDESTGWIVPHRLVALDRDYGPYPAGATWAEPDVAHAAALLARVAEAPEEASERAAVAGRRVRELYSPEAAGARFLRELERILAD